MAHADYDCCAICDCKMNYNACGADAKEAICVDCIERTAELGKLCTRPARFLEHLQTLDDTVALKWLNDLGFSPCFYFNQVDDALIARGFIETGIKGGPKWGKRLKVSSDESEPDAAYEARMEGFR